MKFVVINGSPSGNRGVTAHYVQYLEKLLPEHQFHTFEVAKGIRKLERDRDRLDDIVKQMKEADVILWAYPVYVMLVPAQLKRFIELLFERVGTGAFEGTVTTSISTSAHHYDHTAHDYMWEVSSDLGMTYVRGFSADLEDMLTEEGRRNLRGFARDFMRYVDGEIPVDVGPRAVEWSAPSSDLRLPTDVDELPRRPSQGKVVVISDAETDDTSLLQMIDVFERSLSLDVDRIELRELRMDGGCIGCMRCTYDGVCWYKDDYAAAFEQRVMTADVVIYAGAVRDRFLSARMKTFIDRYFSNGHRPITRDKLMGFIVSGPLSQLSTLREVLRSHVEVAHCQHLGIVTDEHSDSAAIIKRLVSMARATEQWVVEPWYAPQTFRGVGADKNFRDLVYSNRGLMAADHRYYQANEMYDFPQKNLGRRVFNALLLMLRSIPAFRKRFLKPLASGKMAAHRRVLEGVASA